ncbi:MAG TPA: hypothetical protein VFI42_06490 [Thermomicrobiaceae bacterium]|nr:hypothetical protein [Thermomicrobiaceae bacterium]
MGEAFSQHADAVGGASAGVLSVQAVDWSVAGLSALVTGGFTLDVWAHNHGKVDKSFFTPWHAILYSGVALTGVFLAYQASRRRRSLPAGYALSLAGVVLFIVGGLCDLGWHALFGVEADIETLLSPTHLLLAFSGLLILTGPLRSLSRRAASGWRELGPAVIAATLVLVVFGIFTQYAHPFTEIAAVEPAGRQALGISSILLQTALLMGVVLLLVQRWVLPPGALTLLFSLNGLAMAIIQDQYHLLPVMVLGGLAGDLLLNWLRPSRLSPARLRIFAAGLPLALYALYFLDVFLTGTITWSTHLWAGSIVLAGVVGLLLSMLVCSPLGATAAR